MSQMTCGEFVEVVHGLVRMEVLDVALREDALEHAARCGRCSEIMIEAKFLADATESVAQASRALQAPSTIAAELLAELQKNQERVAWWRNVQWAAAGAMAAVLMIALWAASIHPRSPTTSGPRKTPQVSGPIDAAGLTRLHLDAHAAPTEVSVAGLDQQSAKIQPVDESSDGTDSSSAVTLDNLSASATSSDAASGDFVSVPYSEGIGPDDDAMVVRVQLTRESLAQLGFPVDEVHGSDWVRADVLVGQDGWPRGVRLVQ